VPAIADAASVEAAALMRWPWANSIAAATQNMQADDGCAFSMSIGFPKARRWR